MAKQIHQRMEENMYEALAKYAEDNGMSVQDSISQAVAQMLNKQAQTAVPPVTVPPVHAVEFVQFCPGFPEAP